MATCPDCLADVNNPQSRYYRYPFTNCTNCGPRYTIIQALPYDRKNTAMAGFAMCPACAREYNNPLNRRYHAQPVSCPDCGPHLRYLTSAGEQVSTHEQALRDAAKVIREGKILAVKGWVASTLSAMPATMKPSQRSENENTAQRNPSPLW